MDITKITTRTSIAGRLIKLEFSYPCGENEYRKIKYISLDDIEKYKGSNFDYILYEKEEFAKELDEKLGLTDDLISRKALIKRIKEDAPYIFYNFMSEPSIAISKVIGLIEKEPSICIHLGKREN